MNKLQQLLAGAFVVGPTVLVAAPPEQRLPQLRPAMQPPATEQPAAQAAPYQLSDRERAQLRRQLAEYSRQLPRTTNPSTCKSLTPCRSSD